MEKLFPVLYKGNNCKIFLELYHLHQPKHVRYFLNKPHLFGKASLCSDSSQYAKISQPTIIGDFWHFWDRS